MAQKKLSAKLKRKSEKIMKTEEKVYYITEATYSDSRSADFGIRTSSVVTEDEDDGLLALMDEDYYYGSTIDYETRVATDWEIKEYGISKSRFAR